MDVIEMARELGKELQKDERYHVYLTAKKLNDEDEELQGMIGQFNLKRIQISSASSKPEPDQARIQQLQADLGDLYTKIMRNENMLNFEVAKQELDTLVTQVTQIVMRSANGENPDEIDLSSCTGSCSTCGGCG